MSNVDSESGGSDSEGGLGNVNKLIIRPVGHNGKAKKGHLCFDASFETGNLGRVDLVSEFEYDLFIRPDTCSPRLRLWFNFTVNNVRQEQRVIFNIVNISKSKNLFQQGMTPLVRSTNRIKWQRLPLNQVFYYKSAQHQDHYVLSFAFAFDREDELYQFALAYPYSYTRHLGHLDNLILRCPVIKRETLSNSIQNRKIELLTITTENKICMTTSSHHKQENQSRRAVVIFGRIHPGESPSSFVCQGLVDFLVSAHPIAKVLRDYVVFKVIPMLNPDGVCFGNHRSTILGVDLNRTWSHISQWIHPTLSASKALLTSLDKDPKNPLDCVLDVHAHSNATGVFLYGNSYDDVYRYERHIVLTKFLTQVSEDYEVKNTMYNQDSYKEGTARRFFCSILSNYVNCYTIHVSMFGYTRKGSTEILPYTEESYCRVGRNLARALLEYYKVMGIIPLSLPDQPSNKCSKQSYPQRRVSPELQEKTGRKRAPLHLAFIHEYFQENEPTQEQYLQQRHQSMSSTCIDANIDITTKKNHHGKTNSKSNQYRVLTCKTPNKKTNLTIIDFNQLTRGGLDLAVSKSSVKKDLRNLIPKHRSLFPKKQ